MPNVNGPPEASPEQEFEELVKLANTGDQQAIASLRRVLDANPEIWQTAGELSHFVEADIIATLAKGDRLVLESVKRRAEEMRHELLGLGASPLEKLAVKR